MVQLLAQNPDAGSPTDASFDEQSQHKFDEAVKPVD
jgi:hypothetical protein